jgi:hypothetical protein
VRAEGSDVSQRNKVLLLDDGELGRIRGMLRDLDVDLKHLEGEVSSSDLLEGAYDVVFASVRRTLALEGELDLGDLPGKPVWIAAHSQDFLPLRVRLRKLGVQFLVQSSVGSEALQLLVSHTLCKAPEKRGTLRLPVGCPIRCWGEDESSLPAQLLDLSRGGCGVLSTQQFEADAPLSVELPAKLAGGEACTLTGRVQRSAPHASGHLLAVAFDDLPASTLELIESILAGKVIGTVVTRLSEELTEEFAALSLTPRPAADAAPVQEVAPDPSPTPPPEPEPDSNQRRNRRVEYTREVTALLEPGEHVILARDLSVEGMRAEPLPELALGTRIELALYGPSGHEPILVQAEVARDDGEAGTVFRFHPLPSGEHKRLELIIASAPEIRFLTEGEQDDAVVVARAKPRSR